MAAPGTIPHTTEEFIEASARMSGAPLAVVSILKLALGVLADRVFLWVSLMGCFGLYGYSIYDPTILREIVATTYTLLVLTPQLIGRLKGGKS